MIAVVVSEIVILSQSVIAVVVVVVVVIVWLQLPVTDKVFAKNTAEFYSSVLKIFLIIGHTCVGLD